MADLQAKAILSAEDRASAVLAMVSRNFDRLSRAADQLHARDARVAQVGAMNAALERRAAALQLLAKTYALADRGVGMIPGMYASGGLAIAPLVAAAGLVKANKAYAESERSMTRMAMTAEASRDQQEQAALDIERLAQRTGLAKKDIQEGAEELVAAGRKMPEAMAFLPSVANTAQATGASVRDIAKAADAAGEHLGIAAHDMQRGFDIMAAGGKAGKFELKDMARYLAEIAPMAKKAGMQGTGGLADLVSAFQMVRKEAGTSEEAATNLKNVFSKMYSEETGNKFKEAGVDLRKRLDAAEAKGENLLETFAKITAEVTKSGKVKLPELFQDMQAQAGMSALLANLGEWKRLSKEIEQTSAGTVLRDLGRVTKDAQHGFDGLSNAAGRAFRNLGKAVGPAVAPAIEAMTRQLSNLNEALERSEIIARRLKNDPSVSPAVKTKAEREAEELAFINNLDMNASRATSRKAEYGGDYTVKKGKGGYELVPKKGAKKSQHEQIMEALRAREEHALRVKQQEEQQRILDHRARMEMKVRDDAMIGGRDADLNFPNSANDPNMTAGPYKWSQLLADERRYRDAKRKGAGGRGAGGSWAAHDEAIPGLIDDIGRLSGKLRELDGRGPAREGSTQAVETSATLKALQSKIEQLLIHKTKRDGGDMPTSGDIQGVINELRGGKDIKDLKAEVKPDQITAKVEGKVETVTTVKVEASPNFITSIVSQVKSQIGPVFGSAGGGDGTSNP